MKKYLLSMTMVLLAGSSAFAGGAFCKQCPGENDVCIPICDEEAQPEQPKCNIINVITPAAGACCSWGENIPNCFKGC